ncbi:MAG: recombination-associated protein RdgC [Planctomycetota bacterium]
MKFRRSGSLSRFFVEGDPADVSDLSLIKALERDRFKPLEGAIETESSGWITRGDASGARFPAEDLIHGHFLVFASRVDRKKVSPALLKIQISADMRAAAAGSRGDKPMARAQKKQIIDDAIRKLTARALPTVAITDCIWNCKERELIIFSTGASTVEMIASAFRETFRRTLVPATVSSIAASFKFTETERRLFKELSPTQLLPKRDHNESDRSVQFASAEE